MLHSVKYVGKLSGFFILLFCTACTNAEAPYTFDKSFYSTNAPHPADYIESLEIRPTNECEKEQLRRLIISLSMYSNERHNQTYMIDLSSSGGKIITTSFEEALTQVQDKIISRGNYNGIKLKVLSDALRENDFKCSKR